MGKWRITKEIKISLAAIGALAMLVFVVNFLKGIDLFRPSCYYYVSFADANRLTKSAPVYVDGYSIGIVSDITFDYDHPGHVVVEVDMDHRIRIPSGSYAELSSNLLGSVNLFIHLDTQSTRYLAVGDTLPGRVDEGLMGRASQTIVPQVEDMMPKLDSILTSLNLLLSNPKLNASVNNIEEVTANLKITTRHLNTLLAGDIPALTHKMNETGDNLVTLTSKLQAIDYAATFRQVDSTLANVKMLCDKLNRKDNSMGLLFNDTTLYRNLELTGRNASLLLQDVKANPKRYVHFSVFGRKDK